MPRIWLPYVLPISILFCAAGPADADTSLFKNGIYNFNGEWRVARGDLSGAARIQFDDTTWQRVTLPHSFAEDEAFRVDIAELPTGIAWYRKTFTLPPDAADRQIVLEFQGVRHAAEVWLNGKSAGLSEDGVMAFGVNLTGFAKPGENVIAVRTDNAWNYKELATGSPFQWNDRNFYANYGGINKNVVLHVSDKLRQTLPLYSSLGTTGVYVYASDVDVPQRTAIIHAESQVRNDRPAAARVTYDVTIADNDGKPVAHFAAEPVEMKPGELTTLSASAPLGDVHFWSWGYGYLYTVTTSLIVDSQLVDRVETKTGFRKTAFIGGAVKLNDRTLQVHGYAQRTTNEWPALGIDVPPWLSDFSNGLMVKGNANVVRWMHVTPSKQDIESCDRVGLIQAMPAADSERDPEGRRWDLRVKLMRDAIVYNRNNPSILFYEGGNKGISEAHMKELIAVRDEFDPHGGRAIGSREMLDSPSAEYGGEMLYINKSAGKPLWAMEFLRDEQLRRYADEFTPPYHKDGDGPPHKSEPAAIYNRNGDSFARATVHAWFDYWRERPGTGNRVSGGGVNIIFSDSNTHHRGAENYRRSGEVDAMRLPKDSYFANQVMWDGWVDVEHPRAHIVGHWNYKPGTVKDVYVISSADRVVLKLNGKSVGDGAQSDRFLFTFKSVAFEAGKLEAIGYDPSGKPVAADVRETTGEPAAIKLTPIFSPVGSLRADGSDVALVDVEVIDRAGRRVPTAFNPITFVVTGPAEWRGGIAQAPNNAILAKTLPVELGVNRVIIRSTTQPGAIQVTASAEGLPTARVAIESTASSGGDLDEWLPAEGLKSVLSRGPTPAGDSVTKLTRAPIAIARAVAGSIASTTRPADNSDEATTAVSKPALSTPEASYDDNEITTWASQPGRLKDAWIRYEFAEPATVSELTFRPGSWRTRSYPIRVLVDDQEAFVGATPRSLGYVTLPLKPTRGGSLTIQLVGEPSDRDELNITEITGKKLVENDAKLKGALRLHEVEIYGLVR